MAIIDSQKIAMRLRVLRKMRGKLQREVCEEIGMTTSTYNNFEKGHTRPNIENGALLAAYYGVTLDYLYFGKLDGIPFAHAREIEIAEHST